MIHLSYMGISEGKNIRLNLFLPIYMISVLVPGREICSFRGQAWPVGSMVKLRSATIEYLCHEQQCIYPVTCWAMGGGSERCWHASYASMSLWVLWQRQFVTKFVLNPPDPLAVLWPYFLWTAVGVCISWVLPWGYAWGHWRWYHWSFWSCVPHWNDNNSERMWW